MDQSTERDFTDFVVRRSASLLRVAHALTGDAHAAEDLVQQALAKAFLHWKRIHGDAEPYVRKIIYNDSASRWRRRGTRVETAMAMPPDLVRVPDRTHDTHLRMVVRDALLTLPPRQRAVLVLRYLEDRTVEETAEVLGCRPGTVASQASRALAKLRDLVPESLSLGFDDDQYDDRYADRATARARAAIERGVSMRRRRTAAVVGAVALVTALALVAPFGLGLRGSGSVVPAITPSPSPSSPTVVSDTSVPTTTVNSVNGPISLVDGWVVLGSENILHAARGQYAGVAIEGASGKPLPSPNGEWAATRTGAMISTYRVTNLRTDEVNDYIVTSSIAQPQWSPDGRTLLFTVLPKTGTSTPEMHLLDVETGSMTVRTLSGRHTCVECGFTWLPNGTEVALALAHNMSEVQPPQPDGIQIFNLDGQPVRQVPVLGRPGGPGAWSPDGRRVAVVGLAADGKTQQTQVVDVATGSVSAALSNPRVQISWVDNERMLVWQPAAESADHLCQVVLRNSDLTAVQRWLLPAMICLGPQGWPDTALAARLP